jgi:hypothetical protein
MASAFLTPRDAARSLLQAAWAGDAQLTRKAASFAGQASVTSEPLSERKLKWLSQLLERAKLPALVDGVAQ